MERIDHIAGILLGTAVGDSLGLPREGMGARRAKRIFGGSPLGQRLVLGRGMWSDDTEHTCMVAQALIKSGGDPLAFRRSLSWRLRWWLLGLPAGVGWGTLRGILKLWLVGRPRWLGRPGVNSAGNGPAMRVAIIGAFIGDDLSLLVRLVQEATEVTHNHRLAQAGARVVAIAAWYTMRQDGGPIEARGFLAAIEPFVHEREMAAALSNIPIFLDRGAEPREFADSLGIPADGISGYVMHTVPVAIYCWLRRPKDFRGAVASAVPLGGDSDTIAAIVGALAGATVGSAGIPAEWLDRTMEWPRSVAWMRRLAERLASGSRRPMPLFWPAILIRNVFFLLIVLLHGLRRLLPPY